MAVADRRWLQLQGAVESLREVLRTGMGGGLPVLPVPALPDMTPDGAIGALALEYGAQVIRGTCRFAERMADLAERSVLTLEPMETRTGRS